MKESGGIARKVTSCRVPVFAVVGVLSTSRCIHWTRSDEKILLKKSKGKIVPKQGLMGGVGDGVWWGVRGDGAWLLLMSEERWSVK